jgi:hypothetical protein
MERLRRRLLPVRGNALVLVAGFVLTLFSVLPTIEPDAGPTGVAVLTLVDLFALAALLWHGARLRSLRAQMLERWDGLPSAPPEGSPDRASVERPPDEWRLAWAYAVGLILLALGLSGAAAGLASRAGGAGTAATALGLVAALLVVAAGVVVIRSGTWLTRHRHLVRRRWDLAGAP